jgi:pyruvate dehydrogenase kinase 2/3/4
LDNNIIILKISDNGDGIDEEDMKHIWKFSFTTSDINFNDQYSNDFEKENPLSGFGYGLPISRILLKIFNGNLKVFSQKGKGTDVYLFIDLNSNWAF